MPTLKDVLDSIDWANNVNSALGDHTTLEKIDAAAHRVALWSQQIQQADPNNPASCFLREMQHSIHHSGALIGLCLYKPSAAASRTFLESCLYYTYFRTHPEELATLVANSKYFIGKREIIEYHHLHTAEFQQRQKALGLVGRLEDWYSRVSAVVHGQLPGTWHTNGDLGQTQHTPSVQALALATLLEGVSIANDLLFCTLAQRFWKLFSPEAKQILVKGLSKQKREALNLDLK